MRIVLTCGLGCHLCGLCSLWVTMFTGRVTMLTVPSCACCGLICQLCIAVLTQGEMLGNVLKVGSLLRRCLKDCRMENKEQLSAAAGSCQYILQLCYILFLFCLFGLLFSDCAFDLCMEVDLFGQDVASWLTFLLEFVEILELWPDLALWCLFSPAQYPLAFWVGL